MTLNGVVTSTRTISVVAVAELHVSVSFKTGKAAWCGDDVGG